MLCENAPCDARECEILNVITVFSFLNYEIQIPT